MSNFRPFQDLYQHLKSTDQKLFDCLNKVSSNLQTLFAGLSDIIIPNYVAPTYAGARAYNSAVQSIPTGASTVLIFDTDEFNIGAVHSISVNNSRFTVPVGQGGIWLVGATVRFASNAVGTRYAWIQKNGANVYGEGTMPAVAGGITVSPATILNLTVGDYIEVVAYQGSGSALNTSGDYQTVGYAQRIA